MDSAIVAIQHEQQEEEEPTVLTKPSVHQQTQEADNKIRTVPLWPSETTSNNNNYKSGSADAATTGTRKRVDSVIVTIDRQQPAVSFPTVGQGGSSSSSSSKINNLLESQEWEPIRASRLPQRATTATYSFGWQEWGVPATSYH
jgi:hypothetical protein